MVIALQGHGAAERPCDGRETARAGSAAFRRAKVASPPATRGPLVSPDKVRVRERFTTLRKRYYLIECAWCKRRIRWRHKQGDVPGETSHSIRPPCAAAIFSDMANLWRPDFG